ncbi:MAG: DMT family transporter [Candidatus Nanopelagicales bacterium]|nr:DMT family transporter [Candidatus Nanopelagicales bacterium]
MQTARLSAWLPYWWALAVVWGSSFFLIKIGLDSFVPLQITFGRVFFGLLAVVAVLVWQRGRLPKPGVVWAHAAFVGLMTNVIPFTLFAWAETRVSSVLAGLFNAATPLFTALFALAIVPSERLTRQRVLGLITGFAGVLVVMGVWQGLSGDLVGSLACLGATLCYGVGVPWTRRFLAARPEGGPSLMGAQLLCSSVVMAVLCLFLTDLPNSVQVSSVLAVAVLGALATGLAFIWMYRVIALAGSVVSASVTYATPLVSTLLGILLLGETLTWNQPLGAVIVLIGAALVQGLIGRPVSERRPSSS